MIAGTKENSYWSVTFDITDGCLGISQWEGADRCDRVLLAPKQVRELLAFVKHHRPNLLGSGQRKTMIGRLRGAAKEKS